MPFLLLLLVADFRRRSALLSWIPVSLKAAKEIFLASPEPGWSPSSSPRLSNSAAPPLIYGSAASLMCERATQYLILLRICRCFLEFKATRITQQHSIITLSCVIVLSITIRRRAEDEGINQGEFLIDVTTSSVPWWWCWRILLKNVSKEIHQHCSSQRNSDFFLSGPRRFMALLDCVFGCGNLMIIIIVGDPCELKG